MIRSTNRLALGGLLAVGIALATGCQKKYTPPPIDTSAIVGNWIEVVEQVPTSPRVPVASAKKHLRHVTINADKTFEFTLRTASGVPVKKKNSEGAWEVRPEEGAELLYFEVANTTFGEDDERRDWAPMSSIGIRKRDVGGHGVVETLVIEDLEGENITYIRAK